MKNNNKRKALANIGLTLVLTFTGLFFNLSASAQCSLPSGRSVYCDVSATDESSFEYINRVRFNTIDNPSGNDGYSYFPNLITDIEVDSTYTLTVNSSGSSSARYGIGVWIDWNRNNVFDASEYIVSTGDNAQTSQPTNINITVPSNASLGLTGMRIMYGYNSGTSTRPDDKCEDTFEDETEDYLLSICSGPQSVKVLKAEHDNLSNIIPSTSNNSILRVKLIMEGCTNPLKLQELNFKLTGTTDLLDVSSVSVFNSLKSEPFNTSLQFDTTKQNPTLSLKFNDIVSLLSDTNYFYLVVDVPSTAKLGNNIDAELVSAKVSGQEILPSIGSPAGKRRIDEFVKFFAKRGGNANALSTWGVNIDGTGSAPGCFSLPNAKFIIPDSSVITANGNWTVNGIGSLVEVQAGGKLIKPAGQTYSLSLTVRNGGKLELSGTTGENAISPTLEPNSTVEYLAGNNNLFNGQWIFGNLIINNAAANYTPTQSFSMTIKGNLTIKNGILNLHNNTTINNQNIVFHEVKGNLTIESGGTLRVSNYTGDLGGMTLNVLGNFVNNGGSFPAQGSGIGVNSTINAKKLILNGGTFAGTNGTGTFKLNVSDSFIVNSGNFTLIGANAGQTAATFNLGHTQVNGGSLILLKASGTKLTVNSTGGFVAKNGGILKFYEGTSPISNNFAVLNFTTPALNSKTFELGYTTATGNLTDGQVNINIATGRKLTLTKPIAVGNERAVKVSGTLLMGNNIVSSLPENDGINITTFELLENGTLGIGSVDGITTGANGNIRTITRTINANSNFIYNGLSAQVSGDLLPATAKALFVENKSGLNLTGSLSLTDSLVFLGDTSLINVSGNSLELLASAKITNAGSSRFVLGELIREAGAETMTFPIGGQTNGLFYSPVLITPTVAGDKFSSEFVHNNPNDDSYAVDQRGANLGNVNTNHYYKVNQTSGSGSAVVGFKYSTSNTGITNDKGLTSALWDGSKWTNTNSTVNTTSREITSPELSTFGVFNIAGNKASGNFGEATPPVAAFSSNFTTGCKGIEITFQDQSTNATSWAWTFTNGTPATSTLQNPKVKFNSAGNHTVKLVVTNSFGSNTVEKANHIEITECGNPVSNFSADVTSGCVDMVVNFEDLSQNTTTWNWTFEGGTPATSTEINPSVTYSTPGKFKVTLEVSNQNGSDVSFKNEYITVNGCSAPVSDFTVNKAQECEGATLIFTDVSKNSPTAWEWTFPGGTPATSTVQNPSVKFNSAGEFDITLKTTNEFGESTVTKEKMVKIILCAEPVAEFEANQTSVCKNGKIDFTDKSTNAVEWNWSFPGGNPETSTDQNPSVTYATPGTYSVTLIAFNTNGNNTNTKEAYITVEDCNATMPTAGFTSKQVGNKLIEFTNTSSDASTYKWTFGDGSNPSTELNPTHQYGTQGTFEACLVATNTNGSDTLCKNVTVLTSSIAPKSTKALDVVIYPNPTNNHFWIKIPENVNVNTIGIFDYAGKQVQLFSDGLEKEINVSELPTGIYFIDIQTDQGRVMKKLIKN